MKANKCIHRLLRSHLDYVTYTIHLNHFSVTSNGYLLDYLVKLTGSVSSSSLVLD